MPEMTECELLNNNPLKINSKTKETYHMNKAQIDNIQAIGKYLKTSVWGTRTMKKRQRLVCRMANTHGYSTFHAFNSDYGMSHFRKYEREKMNSETLYPRRYTVSFEVVGYSTSGKQLQLDVHGDTLKECLDYIERVSGTHNFYSHTSSRGVNVYVKREATLVGYTRVTSRITQFGNGFSLFHRKHINLSDTKAKEV